MSITNARSIAAGYFAYDCISFSIKGFRSDEKRCCCIHISFSFLYETAREKEKGRLARNCGELFAMKLIFANTLPNFISKTNGNFLHVFLLQYYFSLLLVYVVVVIVVDLYIDKYVFVVVAIVICWIRGHFQMQRCIFNSSERQLQLLGQMNKMHQQPLPSFIFPILWGHTEIYLVRCAFNRNSHLRFS